MRKVVGTLVLLVLAAFALPPLLLIVEHLIVPVIIFTFFVGLGVFLIGRKRMW